MTKIVFFFGGTGSTDSYLNDFDVAGLHLKEDVIQIHIAGCQYKAMGNSSVFPNLDIGARNIRQAFNASNKTINLGRLKEILGNTPCTIEPSQPLDQDISVESIALTGFSRGAVTAFATARQLDELDIPMHIVANQPVSGNSKTATFFGSTEFNKNHDLSACKNIESAEVLLGTYATENGYMHDTYFKQMHPIFSNKTDVTTSWLPFESHLHWVNYRSIIVSHIGKHLSEYGFCLKQKSYFLTALQDDYFERFRCFYYVPEWVKQPLLNTEAVDDTIDPTYQEVCSENAKAILTKLNIEHASLQPYQVKVIAMLPEELIEINNSEVKHWLECILKGDEQGKKMLMVMELLQHGVNHLCKSAWQTFGDHRCYEDIIAFQFSMLETSYEFLSEDSYSFQTLKEKLKQIDASLMQVVEIDEYQNVRFVIGALVNTLLFFLSIPLKLLTGDWLVPTETTFEKNMQATTSHLYDVVTQVSEEACEEENDNMQLLKGQF